MTVTIEVGGYSLRAFPGPTTSVLYYGELDFRVLIRVALDAILTTVVY
jgi:hypothetical protein